MLRKLLNRLNNWLFGPSLIVYCACKMTMRDKAEMVDRAEYVVKVFAEAGIKAISPVMREEVKNEPGKLINKDEERLRQFWANDKAIIREEAHAVVLDLGEMKSFGMEREYGLSRYCLWKPTVMILGQGVSESVAKYEDDCIFYSVHKTASYMASRWGCRWDRWVWRLRMLNRSVPGWIWGQILAWR